MAKLEPGTKINITYRDDLPPGRFDEFGRPLIMASAHSMSAQRLAVVYDTDIYDRRKKAFYGCYNSSGDRGLDNRACYAPEDLVRSAAIRCEEGRMANTDCMIQQLVMEGLI